MTKPLDIQAAEWLIVGFNKAWTMQMLAIRLWEVGGGIHFDFMPASKRWYGKCPVRGFVAQHYPKLNDFLISAPPEKQIKAAAQIVKLRPKDLEYAQGSLTTKEQRELTASRRDLRVSTTSYRESRKNFIAHKTTNWNTCK